MCKLCLEQLLHRCSSMWRRVQQEACSMPPLCSKASVGALMSRQAIRHIRSAALTLCPAQAHQVCCLLPAGVSVAAVASCEKASPHTDTLCEFVAAMHVPRQASCLSQHLQPPQCAGMYRSATLGRLHWGTEQSQRERQEQTSSQQVGPSTTAHGAA